MIIAHCKFKDGYYIVYGTIRGMDYSFSNKILQNAKDEFRLKVDKLGYDTSEIKWAPIENPKDIPVGNF